MQTTECMYYILLSKISISLYHSTIKQRHIWSQLKMRGFTKMDALEPAGEMLSIAIAKNIYGRNILDCMDGHRTYIKDGK